VGIKTSPHNMINALVVAGTIWKSSEIKNKKYTEIIHKGIHGQSIKKQNF
jgi:hypothetical protein